MDRPGGTVLVIQSVVGAGPAIQRRSVMSRGKLVTLVAILLVVVVGIGVAVVAVIGRAMAPANDLHVYEPEAFATAAEASKACKIPLPPEAKNVRVAGWSQWVAHETYL